MKILFVSFLVSIISVNVFSQDCKTIPPINKKIVAFINNKIGKKVGDDYCFALVESSYKAAGIEYYNYMIGDKVKYDTDCVFPGDILALQEVDVKYKRHDTTFTTRYPFGHEAYFIIYKIKSKGSFITAVQESLNGVRKVRLVDFDLKQISKGKPIIYRPKK